ncbi:MAG: M23 family metallopeptidase, partial [Ruminococcus sp.]|nr:M23 family metallopeptidase [Ruminococcus sp.]
CGCGGGYGNYVVIDHGNGYWTLYGHMQYTTVSLGDTVSQGQKIGVVGTTGWSTGDHCHFEVRQNGEPVDPTQYVSY